MGAIRGIRSNWTNARGYGTSSKLTPVRFCEVPRVIDALSTTWNPVAFAATTYGKAYAANSARSLVSRARSTGLTKWASKPAAAERR